MFVYNINPVLFTIGPLEVRYYGIIMASSVLLGIYMILMLARKKKIDLDENTLLELCFYMVIAGLIGARILHIILDRSGFYIQNPSEMIAIWHGGLSIHGAVAGAVVAALVYCRKKKISFYKIADIAVIPLALGLCFGRIGNFLNGELYGKITNVLWAVKFPGVEGFRHPSQFYEAFKNLAIFTMLWNLNTYNMKKKRFQDGFIFWTFVFVYSVLRFIVEFFKLSEIYYLSLNIAQIISIGLIILSVPFLIKLSRKPKKHMKNKRIKKK